MYTIGQFSKLAMVSAKTLRFYDDIELLKPARIDKFSQYRYYTIEQLADIILISELRSYDFSLDEIKRMVKLKNTDDFEEMLAARLEELEKELQRAGRLRDSLKRKLEKMKKGGCFMEANNNYRIEIKERPDQQVVYMRRRIQMNDIDELFKEFCDSVFSSGLKPVGPSMAIYHDDEFDPEDADIEVSLPVADTSVVADTPVVADTHVVEGLSYRVMKGGTHASAIHVGSYDGISNVYAIMNKWIYENDYRIINPPFDVYLVCSDPERNIDEDKLVTEICFPVAKNK